MTHDKFCEYDGEIASPCGQCATIAAARADEREQAAQRVAGTKRQLLHYLADKSDSWVCVPLDWAITAARGGEQA